MTLWRDWKSKSLGEILASEIRAWWRSPDTPDPWTAELDAAVHAPDAIPVCLHCTTPCDLPVWFCPVCGAAVGPYNNVMPYLYIFSIGEALRSGVGPEAHFTPFRTVAYAAIALAAYGLIAPLYFIRLYLNYNNLLGRQTKCEPERQELRGPLSLTAANKFKNNILGFLNRWYPKPYTLSLQRQSCRKGRGGRRLRPSDGQRGRP